MGLSILNILAGLSYGVAYKAVNYSCTLFFYQPEIPEKLKQLRKVK